MVESLSKLKSRLNQGGFLLGGVAKASGFDARDLGSFE